MLNFFAITLCFSAEPAASVGFIIVSTCKGNTIFYSTKIFFIIFAKIFNFFSLSYPQAPKKHINLWCLTQNFLIMPIQKVNGGYRWGQSGKIYPTRAQAEAQARAIYASGYREKSAPAKKK